MAYTKTQLALVERLSAACRYLSARDRDFAGSLSASVRSGRAFSIRQEAALVQLEARAAAWHAQNPTKAVRPE